MLCVGINYRQGQLQHAVGDRVLSGSGDGIKSVAPGTIVKDIPEADKAYMLGANRH